MVIDPDDGTVVKRLVGRSVRIVVCADAARRGRTSMTARGPTAGALIVLLSVSVAACGAQTTTVTQPPSDAALGRPIGGAPTRAAGGQAARTAARAFLNSYLQISYGNAPPEQLRSASRALRDRLRTQRARVPPGVRDRTPRIVALGLKADRDGRVRAIATVDDGDLAPYPLIATLERRDQRWVAVSVGG